MKAQKVLLLRRPTRLPNGRRVHYFTLRWQDSDGKDRYESLGRVGKVTASEAKALQRQKQLDLGTGKVRRKHQRISLAVYLDMDRDAIRSEVKPGTIIVHEGTSAHAIAAIGGDIELDKIDWTHVSTLKSWLAGEHVLNGRKLPGCGQATIRKTIVGLKASFNRAIKRGLLDSNPFVGQRLGKTQPKQKRIFSPAEIDALIAASPTLWWGTFVRLAFTSGLRLGELLNTTWADIGESHITVTAKRPGTFTAGGRSYPVLAFSCKSHRERRVPLDPEAAKLLQRLKLKSGGSIYPFLSLDRLAVLAATRDTTQEINAAKLSNNVLRTFKLIQVQARAILAKQRGVDIDKVPWIVGCVHDMRKSFASLAAHHISMPELQKILGHSSIVTTSEFYVDVSDDLGDRLMVAFA